MKLKEGSVGMEVFIAEAELTPTVDQRGEI